MASGGAGERGRGRGGARGLGLHHGARPDHREPRVLRVGAAGERPLPGSARLQTRRVRAGHVLRAGLLRLPGEGKLEDRRLRALAADLAADLDHGPRRLHVDVTASLRRDVRCGAPAEDRQLPGDPDGPALQRVRDLPQGGEGPGRRDDGEGGFGARGHGAGPNGAGGEGKPCQTPGLPRQRERPHPERGPGRQDPLREQRVEAHPRLQRRGARATQPLRSGRSGPPEAPRARVQASPRRGCGAALQRGLHGRGWSHRHPVRERGRPRGARTGPGDPGHLPRRDRATARATSAGRIQGQHDRSGGEHGRLHLVGRPGASPHHLQLGLRVGHGGSNQSGARGGPAPTRGLRRRRRVVRGALRPGAAR